MWQIKLEIFKKIINGFKNIRRKNGAAKVGYQP